MNQLAQYYSERAPEYEEIYEKPERQRDIKSLEKKLRNLFKNRKIIEVACGTGYWTQLLSEVAKSIVAVDFNSKMIDIAKSKHYPLENISFKIDNAFSLGKIRGKFSAGFAAFWWSHLLKSEIETFINIFHSKLQSNALVVFIDNRYVKDNSTLISKIDDQGNSYQIRTLSSGKTFEIVKNYPTKIDIEQVLKGGVKNLKFELLTYY